MRKKIISICTLFAMFLSIFSFSIVAADSPMEMVITQEGEYVKVAFNLTFDKELTTVQAGIKYNPAKMTLVDATTKEDVATATEANILSNWTTDYTGKTWASNFYAETYNNWNYIQYGYTVNGAEGAVVDGVYEFAAIYFKVTDGTITSENVADYIAISDRNRSANGYLQYLDGGNSKTLDLMDASNFTVAVEESSEPVIPTIDTPVEMKVTQDGEYMKATVYLAYDKEITTAQIGIKYNPAKMTLVDATTKEDVATAAETNILSNWTTDYTGKTWASNFYAETYNNWNYIQYGYTVNGAEGAVVDGVYEFATMYFKVIDGTLNSSTIADYIAISDRNRSANGYLQYLDGGNSKTLDLMDTANFKVTTDIAGEDVKVTSITITNAPSGAIEIGATGTLTAEVEPEDATDDSVTWSSDNAAVEIDATSGAYEAISAGTATITATANDGSGVTGTVQITVNKASTDVKVTSITITNAPSGAIEIGATGTLTAEVEPEDATDDSVTWSSDNAAVEIDATSGAYEAISAGTATITATANDGSGVTGTVQITVNKASTDVKVTSITITNAPSGAIEIGATGTLTAEVEPEDATDDSVTWSSDNAAVEIDATSGAYEAISAGTATITATANDGSGVTGTVQITVNQAAKPVTGVSIVDGDGADVTSIELVEGTSQQLSAKVEPADADNTSVTWTVTEGTDFVTVENGLVTAVKAGSATITLASVSNPSATDTVTVTVTAKPYEGPTKAEIAVEENGVPVATNVIIGAVDTTKQLTLIADKEADVTWTITAGSEFATVDSKTGLLTIKGTGLITVTATAVTTAADMTNGTVKASFNVYANGEEVVYLDTPVVGLADTVTNTTFNVTLKSTLVNAYPSKATITYNTDDLTVTKVSISSGDFDITTPGTIELVNLDAQSDVTISFQVANAAIAAGDSTALTLTGEVATVADNSEPYTNATFVENAKVIFTAEAPITVEKLYEVKADAVKAGGSPLYGLKITAEAGKDIKVTDNSGTPRQAYWVEDIQAYVALSDVDYSATDFTGKIVAEDTADVPTVIIGDVDDNGKVLAADALEVAKYMVGNNDAISDQAFIAANINGLYAQSSAMLTDDDADIYDIGRILYLATDVTVEP